MHAWKAASYAQLGNYEDARSALSAYFESVVLGARSVGGQQPTDWIEWISKRLPFKQSKDLDHVLDGLRKAGMS